MHERLCAVLDTLARIGEYAYESLALPPLDSVDEATETGNEYASPGARGRLFDQPDLIR